jgi:selenocysteine lyase/cysteine desulfurase
MNDNPKTDFSLSTGSYLLSHSVGRPLISAQAALGEAYFAPWQNSGREPWAQWLAVIDSFTAALAQLFNGAADDFCPQVNLSSAVTKLVMSLDRLQRPGAVVLMSEVDFPSMGFVMQKALSAECELRFIPKHLDLTDAAVWQRYISADVDLVFVSHAYSNSGVQAPLADIIPLVKERGALSMIDVAQSAGIIPLDLTQLQPDFMVGSSVKWLCSGPGAAYLWVHPERIDACQPKDVGWFSHENPFEFNIHQFRYHSGALRFWGGTPSIAPYAIAAHSIGYFANIGSEVLRAHNQELIDQVIESLGETVVSPHAHEKRSGTLILQFGERQADLLTVLEQTHISVDVRKLGIRVSPHIYNDSDDMHQLLQLIEQFR